MKYVIEFRDLWIKDEHVSRNILKRIKKVLTRIPFIRQEQEVIKYADAVVVVAPNDRRTLKNDYKLYKDKIKLIYNGYDLERIMSTDVTIRKYDFDYISVFGKFGYYDYKYVLDMFKAVKEIRNLGYDLRIVHIGRLDNKTQKALNVSKFPDYAYINTGFLDYAEGISILKKSLATCLIVHYSNALGTKIFDYIYVNKPIIHFSPKSSAIASVLSTCKNAFRCNTRQQALDSLLEIVDNKLDSLDCSDSERYSREIQNDEYLKIIKQVV